MIRRAARVLRLGVLVLAGACGAKTGLSLPDVGPMPPDAAPDLPPPPICIDVPRDGDPVTAALTTPVELRRADVAFLIDATASMLDEIEVIQNRLRNRLVPAIQAELPDAAFAVVLLGEFPVFPYGPPNVLPYELRQPVTTDIPSIEASLGNLPSWGNYDDPEAQVEALYQIATGEGLDPWIPGSLGCPSGGMGGVCFRNESLAIVMLITDAPMHNGPRGEDPYDERLFEPGSAPHTYRQAVEAIRAIGARVVGVGASDIGAPSPMRHLREIATDTGAVDAAGRPFAFDIGERGNGIDDGIVSAIREIASGLPIDVDAVVEDVSGDAIDARDLVAAIAPAFADPPSGVSGMDATRFLGVIPGTRVTFTIRIDPSSLPPDGPTVVVPARIVFRAFGESTIDRVPITIVVLGQDGGGCEEQ